MGTYFDKTARSHHEFQRRIGGRIYAPYYETKSKAGAQRVAKRLRERGIPARVIPDGGYRNPRGWIVYTPLKTRRSVKKRRSSSSRGALPLTKTFNGKRYELGRIRKTKRAALNVAERYRSSGYYVRIVKTSQGYGIYVRKKWR